MQVPPMNPEEEIIYYAQCSNTTYLERTMYCGHTLQRAIRDKWLEAHEKRWHAGIMAPCACTQCAYVFCNWL